MKRWAQWMVVGVVALGSAVALADSGGPPRSGTGAPAIGGAAAENLCTGCHGGSPVNDAGSVEIFGAPNLYVPGATYDMTVRITTANTAANVDRGWGFELTAVSTTDGTGAGTFATIAGQGTQIISGTSGFSTRRYIEQTSARFGTASPADFVVRWTAPNPGIGGINLYASAVAADGTGDEGGDWVYTTSKSLQDTTTAASATSWGALKARYRP